MSLNSEAGRPGSDQRRIFIAAAALLVVLYLPYYVATLDFGHALPRDGTTLLVGRDFLNFWMYGQAAWHAEPGRYYDLATYQAATEILTGPGYPGQLWSYPPTVMLAAAPFGLLPYFAALALWSCLGIALFVAALRLWTRDWRIILALVLGPAALFGLMSGQFAYLAAAAVLAILRWRDSRPVLAGLLLGLLTLKPQLGLFFPILLVASGHWRIIAVAALTALALAAATTLIWGVDVWTAYLTLGLSNQSLVLSDPDKLGGPFMPTIFMNARLAGVPVTGAMAIQALASLAAAAMIWVEFRRRPASENIGANALFLAASVFGTPYLLSYDTLSLACLAVLLSVREGRTTRLALLVYLLPLIQLATTGNLSLPGAALIPVAFALLLGDRARGWRLRTVRSSPSG